MHSILRIFLVAGAMVAILPIANALHPAKLEGEYQLGGRLDHQGSPARGKSHLYISLTAGAAKGLYESLAGDPRKDPCTGYKLKSQGNVGCYEIEPGKRYFCSFSINLERDAVEAGLGGCI